MDWAFTQDIFDFKTTLRLTSQNEWANPDDETIPKKLFEIRSRFYDSLTAPYWRAVWGKGLPDPENPELDRRLASMIRRYQQARTPNYFREYLRARTHALRWIEERISKNREITKPQLSISELRSFVLGTDSVADAAVDFLRLDQHIKTADWVAQHLLPPADRVASFVSIPLKNIRVTSINSVTADLDYESYGIEATTAAESCSISERAMVRLTPRFEDPINGQSVGLLFRASSTCIIEELNWDTGQVRLSVIPLARADRYRLQSNPMSAGQQRFEHALIDESPSDYVAPHVERRLRSNLGVHVFSWFDPTAPVIPEAIAIDDDSLSRARAFLNSILFPPLDRNLSMDQQRAILEGLSSRVQLLQGPPGTGKTQMSAVAVLLRIALKCTESDVVLIGGPTHLAVDTLLQRISLILENFRAVAESVGLQLPNIKLIKVHTSEIKQPAGEGIIDLVADEVREFVRHRRSHVLVIGGVPSALLKAAEKFNRAATFATEQDGTFASALFVDEASMMVFPNFLALATLVKQNGEIIVAGDHRQLAPIVAHDWEREDRPPTVLYQPYVSAYEAVQRLITYSDINNRQISRSALEYSFRLPPEIRTLISRIYEADEILLRGQNSGNAQSINNDLAPEKQLWARETGLYLIVHDERESRRSNPFEANIIKEVLRASEDLTDDSVAVITPHRAQRVLLRRELRDFERAASIIDTVERLQGGERSTVIVSGTVSDPATISLNVEFLLNLNRANVAFSRAENRLIVVCSRSLLDYIPAEIENYESAQLWKALRQLCSEEVGKLSIDGKQATIFSYSSRTGLS